MNESVRTAVVLAGGAALRLRPLTDNFPKAMIKVTGKPLLEWILEWLKRNGLKQIVIGVAYRKEAITEYFGDGTDFGANIKYSEHTVEGGTGEGFRLAIKRHVHDDCFLAMNGDELTDIEISRFTKFHQTGGKIATIALAPLRSPFGTVDINDRNAVLSFREKPVLREHLVSTGVYIFQRAIMGYLPTKGSVERETFPKLAAQGELKGYIHDGFWGTVNTIKDLQDLELKLSARAR
jgi:NDP-sugar pyrophosphorylase family protein